jgi:hypothetical protein
VCIDQWPLADRSDPSRAYREPRRGNLLPPTLKADGARSTTILETRGRETPADRPLAQPHAFEYRLFQ